jgi:hypothetical protein
MTTFMTTYTQQITAYGQQKEAVDRHNKQKHRHFLNELQIVRRQDQINANVYTERLKARHEDIEAYAVAKDIHQLAASLSDASSQLSFKEKIQEGLFSVQSNLIKELQAQGELAASGVQAGRSLGALAEDTMRKFGFADSMIEESFDSSQTALGINHYRSAIGQYNASVESWNQIDPGPTLAPLPGQQPSRPFYEPDPEPVNALDAIMQGVFAAAMTGIAGSGGGGSPPPGGTEVAGVFGGTEAASSIYSGGAEALNFNTSLNLGYDIPYFSNISNFNFGRGAWLGGGSSLPFNTGAASIVPPNTVPPNIRSALRGMGGQRSSLAIRYSSPVLEGQSATQWGGLNNKWSFPGVQQNLGLTGDYTRLGKSTLIKDPTGGFMPQEQTVGAFADDANLKFGQRKINVQYFDKGGVRGLRYANRAAAEAHLGTGRVSDTLVSHEGQFGLQLNRFQIAELQQWADMFPENLGVDVFSGQGFYVNPLRINPNWYGPSAVNQATTYIAY